VAMAKVPDRPPSLAVPVASRTSPLDPKLPALAELSTNSPLRLPTANARSSSGLDRQDEDGSTALHLAARGGHRTIAEALILCGAKLGLSNKQGKTAAGVAASLYLQTVIRDPSLVEEAARERLRTHIQSSLMQPYTGPLGRYSPYYLTLPTGVYTELGVARLAETDSRSSGAEGERSAPPYFGVSPSPHPPSTSPVVSRMRTLVSTWSPSLASASSASSALSAHPLGRLDVGATSPYTGLQHVGGRFRLASGGEGQQWFSPPPLRSLLAQCKPRPLAPR
jgi:hypothetical protein